MTPVRTFCAFDHRHLPDLDSGHVGDRIERARLALERNAKIARPRVGLRRDQRQREGELLSRFIPDADHRQFARDQ